MLFFSTKQLILHDSNGEIILIAVISEALYHTNEREHSVLYKINKNVFSKLQKQYINTHAHAHAHTHTYINTCTRARAHTHTYINTCTRAHTHTHTLLYPMCSFIHTTLAQKRSSRRGRGITVLNMLCTLLVVACVTDN